MAAHRNIDAGNAPHGHTKRACRDPPKVVRATQRFQFMVECVGCRPTSILRPVSRLTRRGRVRPSRAGRTVSWMAVAMKGRRSCGRRPISFDDVTDSGGIRGSGTAMEQVAGFERWVELECIARSADIRDAPRQASRSGVPDGYHHASYYRSSRRFARRRRLVRARTLVRPLIGRLPVRRLPAPGCGSIEPLR
jgi:hypothetical protein